MPRFWGPADHMAALPRALSPSWTVKQQCVDLLAEGLWEELLDDEQPRITVMDWCVPPPRPAAQPGSPKRMPRPVLPESLLPLQDPAPSISLAPLL